LKTIFVVDDSDTNLSMAEEALEDEYNVMTVPSGARMLALLEKMTPNLILLDIEMPDMNGFEALEKLKANPLWADIPVIFLTGTINDSIQARGLGLGALGFVNKPFTASELLDCIKTRLK
jgi:putative two-component system response regulator